MQKVSPSWSILGKGRAKEPSVTPGPGDYSTQSPDPIKFAVTNSQRQDTRMSNDSPGPGSYSPELSSSSPRMRYSST